MPATKNDQHRISISIQKPYLDAFDRLLKQIRLRRDAYLNDVLPDEVDLLERIPPNSARAKKYFKHLRAATDNKARLSLTLDKNLVDRMNRVCKEKGVIRDVFLESFITFLALGDEENDDINSPLVMALDYLNSPRRNDDRGDGVYSDLSIRDEELDRIFSLPKDLTKLFKAGSDDN